MNFSEPADVWGDEIYRRGLYTHWQRMFLHPPLAFDALVVKNALSAPSFKYTPTGWYYSTTHYVEAARALLNAS